MYLLMHNERVKMGGLAGISKFIEDSHLQCMGLMVKHQESFVLHKCIEHSNCYVCPFKFVYGRCNFWYEVIAEFLLL